MTRVSDNRGFTLIELIIFIIIGGIFLPVSMIAFSAAMKSAATPDYYVKARFYAEQKMEELTSYSYASIPVSGSDTPETGYARVWTVTLIDSSLATSGSDVGYKKIATSVTPPGGSAYDATTIMTKRPKAP